MNIKNDLQQLQAVQPSSKLLDRLKGMTTQLPPRAMGFNAPLFAFRTAIVGLILFLLSGMGTGVLLAAKGSSKGNVLFPLRQTLEKHNVPFFQTPHAMSAEKGFPVRSDENKDEENNEDETRKATDLGKDSKQSVKGIVGDEKENNEKGLEDHVLPTQQVEGTHVDPEKEEK